MTTIDTPTDNRRADDARLAWNQPGMTGPDTLALSSPDFPPEGPIPLVHATTHIGGDNVSPELRWNAAPVGTVQLLLVMEDPDAPMPQPFPHCLALLDPSRTDLPQGALTDGAPTPGVRLLSTRWARGYFGPGPIEGHGPHRYAFQLFALSAPADIPEAVTTADVTSAAGTVLARGRYDGVYER